MLALSFKEIDMNREEAIKRLVEIQKINDTEQAHCDADDVIINLLADLGYSDVVAEFNKIEKWYA